MNRSSMIMGVITLLALMFFVNHFLNGTANSEVAKQKIINQPLATVNVENGTSSPDGTTADETEVVEAIAETTKTIHYNDLAKQAQAFFESGFGENRVCPEGISIADEEGAYFSVPSCPDLEKYSYTGAQIAAMERLVKENQPHAAKISLALGYSYLDEGETTEGFQYLRDYVQRTGYIGELYRAQVEYAANSLAYQRQVLFNQYVLVAKKYPGFTAKMMRNQKEMLKSMGAKPEQISQWSEEAQEAIKQIPTLDRISATGSSVTSLGGVS